ncbi:DUF397 domain-containing protein [Streptomyces sp. JV176]|uniref:DUF397 domain-containing protein n=1 Tax=Streptomyces sp. JV176 TaxID=858630 RepID=UPI002E75F21C|nr:DUF397 domain-containing protein [Streptomyces sp. JV176]MEE1803765.1 DUF397 domain-containing protein [Streptomyces sp. JV176]
MTTETPRWFTSSYSENGGQCIEVAANLAVSQGIVPVRDSKNPHGPALALAPGTWGTFVAGLRQGAFPAV